jgi:hypothetical protein
MYYSRLCGRSVGDIECCDHDLVAVLVLEGGEALRVPRGGDEAVAVFKDCFGDVAAKAVGAAGNQPYFRHVVFLRC